jgi:uncharacterized membrane protein YhaH (DUF805 family)
VPRPRTARRRTPLLWLFFGLSGRISRSVYWLAYAFIVCVQSALLMQLFGGPEASYNRIATDISPAILLATIYVNIATSVKRLHDVGYSGFLAFAVLVPVVNLAFNIWVGILPGTAGPNSYGNLPNAPST